MPHRPDGVLYLPMLHTPCPILKGKVVSAAARAEGSGSLEVHGTAA